jgi:3-oxoacyl-[acyl-carrier-protein] synthase II
MKRVLATSPLAISHRRVVVTGVGAISPLGQSFVSTWENLISPTISSDTGITTFEEALALQELPSDVLDRDLRLGKMLPCQVAAPVRNVPYDTRTSRFVQFALQATDEAVKSSNLTEWLGLTAVNTSDHMDEELQYRRTRAGACIASGMSSIREVINVYQIMESKNSLRRINPHFVPKILTNAPSSRVSLEFQLQGPNLAPSTACAAGGHAIGEAMRCIQYGDADIMIAGGTEACIDPLSMGGFCRLKALSTKFNDMPLSASRPFDDDRDGFVMGEGASVLVLEEMEHAIERGANILCELRGYGLSGDAYHVTSPDPDGKGAERAIRMALERAGLEPGDVDYVNAHATSTPMGDEIEERIINKVLCDEDHRTNDLHVSSTKGATGHLLGAAGAMEAAITVNAIVKGLAPQSRNLNKESPKGFFKHVIDSPERKDINVAINNSFGFGGTNACLVFASAPPTVASTKNSSL